MIGPSYHITSEDMSATEDITATATSFFLLYSSELTWNILLQIDCIIMTSLLDPVTETKKKYFCMEIMKRLDFQRRNEHFCDVILDVGSGADQARLNAHRIILCAASPFFYNALHSEMKEKKEGVIRLKETGKAMMEEVLEYLYTGHVDVSEQNAYELMAVADYYLIPSLKLLSSKFIQQTLSISNCVVAYYTGVKCQCAELQERAKSFIFTNFVAVAESEDFLNLSVKEVEEWISSDAIVVKDEEEVFMVILRWIAKNARRRQTFFDLFRHVRCVYVSRNYLVTTILQHQLVRGRKQCMDLVVDAMKKVSDGTDACFLNQPPRNCLKSHENAILACRGMGTNRVTCYVPSQNKWYKMADKHYFGNPHSVATSACQGKLYVIGANASQVQRYDPFLNSWASVKPLDQEIKFPSAVTFQGYLFVIGGVAVNDKRLSTVQRYNPDSNTWQEAAPLICHRADVCAVADSDNKYAIGGRDGHNVCLDVVEKFDPEVNSWSIIAPMQVARKTPGGVSLQNKIFVFGGVQESGGCPCEMYNKMTNVWTNIRSNTAPRDSASAVCFKGKIFVYGRFRSNQNDDQKDTLQVYNVDKNDWTPCQTPWLGPWFYRLSLIRIPTQALESLQVIG